MVEVFFGFVNVDIADANGTLLNGPANWFLYATVKTTEVPLPASQTFVFQSSDGGIADALATVSFASKKGDKAKYAVELVWRDDQLFAGHVTRTWKEVDPMTKKSANLSASGTVEVK